MSRQARQLIVHTCAVVSGIVAVSAVASAQVIPDRTPRSEAGIQFEVAQPVGDFGQNENRGVGGNAHFLFGLDPAAKLGIRLDAGYFNFGSEMHYLPSSALHEDTSNDIVVGSIGPQLTLPVGRVRPYVNAGVGIAFFYTQKGFNTSGGVGQPQNTTAYSSFTKKSLLYTGGTGVSVPVTVAGKGVAIDVGARFNSVNNAEYFSKNHIRILGSESSSVILPYNTAANFIAYHLGLSARF